MKHVPFAAIAKSCLSKLDVEQALGQGPLGPSARLGRCRLGVALGLERLELLEHWADFGPAEGLDPRELVGRDGTQVHAPVDLDGHIPLRELSLELGLGVCGAQEAVIPVLNELHRLLHQEAHQTLNPLGA